MDEGETGLFGTMEVKINACLKKEAVGSQGPWFLI